MKKKSKNYRNKDKSKRKEYIDDSLHLYDEEEQIIDERKNVLILNMSLIQKKIIHKYKHADDFICCGVSALEPVSKYVINNLAESGKTLDHIVIIASPEARDCTRTLWEGKSAVDVYLERINEYIQGLRESSYEDGCENLAENKISETINPALPMLYKNGLVEKSEKIDSSITYEIVPFDFGDKPDELIKLKNTIAHGNDRINLYIDTQGGNRNWTIQMNTIMEMLKADNAKICGRYSVNFNPNKKYDYHEITDVDKFYSINELLMAFVNFKKYGIGDDLFDYLENNEDEGSKDLKKMISVMKDALDALLLCDMPVLDEKLNAIEKMYYTVEIITDSRINLILQELVAELKRLRGKEYAEKIINRIEWCVEKKMLVQALNIVESRFLGAFNELNLLQFSCDDETKCFELAVKYLFGNVNRTSDTVFSGEERERVLNAFLLREFFFQRFRGISFEHEIKIIRYDDIVDSIDEAISSFVPNGQVALKGDAQCSYSLCRGKNSYVERMLVLGYLYIYVKSRRNGIDHVNGKNFAHMAQIKDALVLMVEVFRHIYGEE